MSVSTKREKVFRTLYLIGIIGFVIGLPLNKVVLSLATMWLVLVTLLRGSWQTVWNRWRAATWLHAMLLFFGWYLLSLAWSDDLSFAAKDLQVKAPFFILPFVFAAHPSLSVRESKVILMTFVGAVAIVALVNWGFFHHWWGTREYDDVRGMSLFISHVRFSLMVTLAWAVSAYFGWTEHRRWVQIVFFLLLIGFSTYAYYSQVLSGLFTMVGVSILAVVHVYRQTTRVAVRRWIGAGAIVAVCLLVAGLSYFFKAEESKIDLTDRPLYTAEGNPYYYDDSFIYLENGYPIYWFINTDELRREWNRRSELPLDSLDHKGQPLHGTVLRYMTSKGLRKDAAGVRQLSPEDIRRIESGIPSVLYRKSGFLNRIRGLKTEFKNQHDPNGHSLLQRLEYWRTGWGIWLEYPWFGVGIGDVQTSFDRAYVTDASKLLPQNRLRTHQQFLTIALSTGVVGLFLFLGFWWTWLRNIPTSNRFLALVAVVICLLSCLVEDTLETQMGVAFVAFGLLFRHLFSAQDLSEHEG